MSTLSMTCPICGHEVMFELDEACDGGPYIWGAVNGGDCGHAAILLREVDDYDEVNNLDYFHDVLAFEREVERIFNNGWY